MSDATVTLKNFVSDLLTMEGAVVESPGPQCLEFIAPSALQATLKAPEFGRLWFGQAPPAGAAPVTFESDWLNRFQQVVGERGRSFRYVSTAEAPPLSNAQRVLEHGLVLQNAIHRLAGVTAAWTRYLLMTFRYTALADDKRDGLIHLAVNLLNGSTPDDFIPVFLNLTETGSDMAAPIPPGAVLPPLWSQDRLNRFVATALPRRVEAGLEHFMKGIRRRSERDLDRLFDYYNQLWRESLARGAKQGEDEREANRREAVQREYRAKVEDLKQNYALKVEVEHVQTLDLITSVRRLDLLIKRRKKERRIQLDWNPIARKLEPPPCEYSFTGDGGRMVCDDALHIVSLPAHSACANCEKEYCRACHPVKCPKCGR